MPSVYYSTPFSYSKNIGKALNEFCALVPNEDDWICLRDMDTLFLHNFVGRQIQDIISRHGDTYHMFGCLTNRLAGGHQLYGGKFSDDPDIHNHYAIAQRLYNEKYDIVTPVTNAIAGMFMLFPKWIWTQFKFPENSIIFDTSFCQNILAYGGKIGVCQGIYMFHLYRWGKPNPKRYKKHLI